MTTYSCTILVSLLHNQLLCLSRPEYEGDSKKLILDLGRDGEFSLGDAKDAINAMRFAIDLLEKQL